ncbi:unnamed protein product [Rotaria sp. Silwood2]|nr:unnamed protein product [Rotaria sp. Silwood2]CAF2536413.1 unnamed protein product [Rotaria sp. Silwood2]CAF3891178.1 unnamed protein product [Rotaria sp. Silwood2]CAF3898209.1 unnamed protein product [Rotaria sp. Silwood2]CAF4193354.1 unnamed protein product [Rotaria sp. Silwood2]
MYYSYEKVIDVNTTDDSVTREAIDGMTQNFGRVPYQLLTEPHPQRQSREQATFQIDMQGRSLNIFQDLRYMNLIPLSVVLSKRKFSIWNKIGWLSYDKSSNNLFTFERDATLQFEKNRLTIAASLSSSINITSHLFALSHDGKFIFSGGHWDWSLCIYSLAKSKTISSIIYHTDIITCLALDSTGYILVTGSQDRTCVIWYLSLNDNRHIININDQDPTLIITPEMVLYGHTVEITCVCVSSELDHVVSALLYGTCSIYTNEHGIYVRTLRSTDASNSLIVNLKLSNERLILVQTKNKDTNVKKYHSLRSLTRNCTLRFLKDLIVI